MIGGLNPNNPYIGTPVSRERNDSARAPAVRPELLTDDRQRALPEPAGVDRGAASAPEDTDAFLRRIQARAVSEDVRFEPFRSDDIPLANARALQTFLTVANHCDGLEGYDAELAGVDIRV